MFIPFFAPNKSALSAMGVLSGVVGLVPSDLRASFVIIRRAGMVGALENGREMFHWLLTHHFGLSCCALVHFLRFRVVFPVIVDCNTTYHAHIIITQTWFISSISYANGLSPVCDEHHSFALQITATLPCITLLALFWH